MDTPFGREGSDGSEGAEGSEGEGGRQSRPALKLASPCLQGEGDHVHYPLASPIHGGGGPRKRWKGLASGDNASYSFLHHSGGTPFGGWRTTFPPIQGALWVLDLLVNLRVEQQRKKNHTTGSSARGNAPLLPPSAASPPEGEICSTLCVSFHK